jgi:hypothetical protein
MDAESPIADIERRMLSANVSSAFLVETWDGRNRRLLAESAKFSVALCYRQECRGELLQVTGVRMSTEAIRRDGDFCREIAASGKTLIAHAEEGVGPLCREIARLREIKVYVPHLGWPIKEGKLDRDWGSALKDFASMPLVTIGISAIAHFSSQPFPHDDVRDLALGLVSLFPASRIAIGSDYPLFEKERYADYMGLARDWLTWKTGVSF